MSSYIIKDARIVNEGETYEGDVLVKDGRIEKIASSISEQGAKEIDANANVLMPGVIDDQVHFREPGLTHKADIYTESRAAVAGGITSYMEMPNTNPQTLTQDLLEAKYQIGKKNSLANYSFFMGVSNHNLEEALKTDSKTVCGMKIFMGSSTGDMLVDDEQVLDSIFKESPMLIATHCEDEKIIRENMEDARSKYGEEVPIELHPEIRSARACYASSSLAVELAKKHNTRLHILHISTGKETDLFDSSLPLADKRITSEACIHHLWFTDNDYAEKGSLIKWNPAVKTSNDRSTLIKAVLENKIDVIATDHAPHTLEEKQNTYFKAPSGGPLVQHALPAMLEYYHQGVFSLERIVEKMCHNPAICFNIEERGFIREGYWADLVLLDLDSPWQVKKDNILYKCNWSPFEGDTFRSRVTHTFVSGHLAYSNKVFDETKKGERLLFSN